MSTFLLEIVTPERKVFGEEVDMVSVRGTEGGMGIMAHHLPLVTPLKIASIIVKQNNIDSYIAVSGGFVEVRKDKVVILAENAEFPAEIDLIRAQAAKLRAEQRLSSSQDVVDIRRAESALQRAVMRIEVKKRFK